MKLGGDQYRMIIEYAVTVGDDSSTMLILEDIVLLAVWLKHRQFCRLQAISCEGFVQKSPRHVF